MIRRFTALTPAERRLVVELAARAVVVRAALRVVPFTTLLAWLDRPPAGRRRSLDASAAAHLLHGTLDRLGRFTCLEKALTLYFALQRRGIAAELTIGVRRRDHTFAAHAWLTAGGQTLIGAAADGEYAPLCSFRSIPTAA
jgi:hypothetical protein